MTRSSLCAVLGALVLSSPSFAIAADAPSGTKSADDAKKAEAAQRFDRGLTLFDDGDNSGALAEFKRTYELFPNPVVLYNIGLVYAAMGRPVDAVDSLEPAVAGTGLSPSQLERAKSTLADQKARIGRLTVTTTPDGARIEVDNVEVAKTPLTAPLRVSEGNHIVGAVSEGFAPARKEVVVAGNQDVSVQLELVPTQGKRLANLTVRTSIADADVRVDGEAAGKTPLATSLTLIAGHHKVQLSRAGYTAAVKEIDVGEAATGELDFELAIDPTALGREGATLALDPSESGSDLTIDGDHKGPYTAPLRLPRGAHHLSVAAPGFYPIERDVTLDPSQTNVVHVQFEPTPETLAAYKSSAYFHRTWGIIGMVGGAAIAGGGAAFLVVNSTAKKNAQTDLDAIRAKNAAGLPPCDVADGFINGGGSSDECQNELNDAGSKVDSTKNRDVIGYVGIGVGAAALVTGFVVFITGNDPHRYDKPASRALGQSDGPRLALAPGPGQFGTGLSLSF